MKLAIYKPEDAMLKLREYNTPIKCMSSQTPALAEIRKEKGEKATLAFIEVWIDDMNEFLNIQRKMSGPQIMQTAAMILGDFYYFKVADINLVFTRAKKGVFGELYGSLDGSKIYQWFVQYDCERSGVVYEDALKEHDIIKERR